MSGSSLLLPFRVSQLCRSLTSAEGCNCLDGIRGTSLDKPLKCLIGHVLDRVTISDNAQRPSSICRIGSQMNRLVSLAWHLPGAGFEIVAGGRQWCHCRVCLRSRCRTTVLPVQPTRSTSHVSIGCSSLSDRRMDALVLRGALLRSTETGAYGIGVV
jgi:hypothetical protein